VAVLAGSLASLAGVAPVRSVEQWLSPVLGVLDRSITSALPVHSEPLLAELAGPARDSWSAWARSVRGSSPVAAEGWDAALVPVVERRRDRHELVIAVPPGALREGGAVTHRGVLVGLVDDVSSDGTRATVALLGRQDSRPIAAEWRPTDDGARAVHFLLTGAENRSDVELRVQAASSSVPPPAEQLAWTRDVAELGDPLAPNLLIGRFAHTQAELPGGGVWSPDDEDPRLTPLLDPFTLDLVTVEVRPGSEFTLREVRTRLYGASLSEDRRRIAAGSRSGVRRGDWVVQDALFVGVVEVASAFSSIVDTRVPEGLLFDVSPGGEIVAIGASRGTWPTGWEPARGDLIAAGHLATGGLVIGTVESGGAAGLSVRHIAPDPTRAVRVVGP
jgi:hypothetical protein